MVQWKMQVRKYNRQGLVSTPSVVPNVNARTIAYGLGTSLMNGVSKVADSLPNTRSICSVCRVLDVIVLEVAILEPCRPDGAHGGSLPTKLYKRHIIYLRDSSNAQTSFHLRKGSLGPKEGVLPNHIKCLISLSIALQMETGSGRMAAECMGIQERTCLMRIR